MQEVADRAVARSPEVEVDVLYRASRTQLLGRRALLDSALQNLVENAQQHAAQGTHVEVYVASTDDGSIRTSVKNHGPAISEANRSKVWARFFTTRGDSGGTGLGLPIVKTIIQAHGGTLELTSSDADGTVFSFVLS